MDIFPATGSIIDSRYRVIDLLGLGGTAVVLKCEDIYTGEFFAIKRFFKDKMSPELKKRIFEEPKLRVNSPYIAKPIKAFSSDRRFHQVSHLLSGEDLSSILSNGEPLNEMRAGYFACSMAQGISDLNNAANPAIVITDLKPENSRIIRDNKQDEKLVIFDLTCFEYAGKRPEFSLGTEPYAAPELIKREPLSQATDIYSLAVIFFEMLVGEEQFTRISAQWDLNIKRGYKPDISAIRNEHPFAFDIINMCIEPNPLLRLKNINDLLETLNTFYKDHRVSPDDFNNSIFHPVNKVNLACDNGRDFCLKEGITLIGRKNIDPWNMYISEKHFEAKVEGNSNIFIRDAGSKCGTRVNGQFINNQWFRLKDEDVIQTANVSIFVRFLFYEDIF
jgi:serine/threonine-protein kinase